MSVRNRMGWGLALLVGFASSSAWAGGEGFSYAEPGDLTAGSGTGAADYTVYAPGMRFPIENGPAYPNSQVWGHGGGSGPGGSQCDVENYSYPWRDNYCETRSWDMPLCPTGVGHQGQDIRPATCENGVHWNVASEAGQITNIGSYSVYITAEDGTRFDYLHGSGNVVSSGQAIGKGERINQVSNAFGGTPTTIHLHYNIRQDISGVGFVFVSPYMSLVESYEDLLGIGGDVAGAASAEQCSAIVGWAQDEAEPEASIDVQVYFDGNSDDPNAVGVEIPADIHREELCESLGSCEHGFSLELPLSLRDGADHQVVVYGVGADGGAAVELETNADFNCAPPAVPDGVRRWVSGPEVLAAWDLSPFWDAASVDQATVDGVASGEDFPDEPVLVRSDDPADSDTVWLMDPGFKRPVPNEAIAQAWGLELASAEVWPAAVLADVTVGTPLREDVFMLQAPDGNLYVIDDEQCEPDDDDCEPPDGPGGTGGGNSGSGGGGDDDDGGSGGAAETDGDTDPQALPGADDDGDGCGCRSEDRRTPWWLLWLVPGVVRRRRRTP